MGAFISKEDTVVTTWRKHELEIEAMVVSLSQKFVDGCCTIGPGCYCPNYSILIDALDEYLSFHLDSKYYEAYMYNHGRYSKFRLAFGGRQDLRTLSSGVCVGISLNTWPHKNDESNETNVEVLNCFDTDLSTSPCHD